MILFSPNNGLRRSIFRTFVHKNRGGRITTNVPNPPQSDSESMSTNTPDYYFDRYDPRSLFHDHFHDSDDWYDTFTGLEIHHGPDPFDSY